jgi:hypothetical protein
MKSDSINVFCLECGVSSHSHLFCYENHPFLHTRSSHFTYWLVYAHYQETYGLNAISSDDGYYWRLPLNYIGV